MDLSEKCDYINFVSIGNGARWKVTLQGGLMQPGFLRSCLPHPTPATPAWLPPASVPGSLSLPRAAPRRCLDPNPARPYLCSQLSQVFCLLCRQLGGIQDVYPVVLGFSRLLSSIWPVVFCKTHANIPLTNLAEMQATDSKVTEGYNRPRWADRWTAQMILFLSKAV